MTISSSIDSSDSPCQDLEIDISSVSPLNTPNQPLSRNKNQMTVSLYFETFMWKI